MSELVFESVIKKFGMKSSRMLEIYLWVFLCFLFSGRIWIANWQWGSYAILKDITSFYFDILAGIGVGLFPIVYYLVFSQLPIESLRENRKKRQIAKQIRVLDEIESSNEDFVDLTEIDNNVITSDIQQSINAKYLMEMHSEAAKTLSEKIYNRSGVYLLIGVLIAFLGMTFFYTQTIFIKDIKEINTLVFLMLPKFGVLFFIELIAFFFLKQYRASMEEFRYYEEIKRIREDNLAVVLLANEIGGNTIKFADLLEQCNFGKKVGRLSKGETTEQIESKKLEKDELEIFEKIIGVINKSKK